MNKVKAFYNKNFKFLMLLFSINPIVNIVLDNKKKEVLQSNFSQFGFILTIVISLVFIYYHNNLERVKRINTEKTSFVVFAIFSLICSILKFTFIETLIISFEGTLVLFVLMTVFINKINRLQIARGKDNEKKEEKLYNSRLPSKDRILEILKGDTKSLILVDGEWGIGKTFFMDKVLDEGKNILAVKVDVLLFNEKKQMINFVMEEINKILLEKGIRSTSIRKYLSVINDGIDNKFIKGVYKAFSNEKTEDIEKNIKEDIEALKDEKLVVIVDNLERTLDKKITIDILGFLHYIYEKLGVNVVVLADSSKLREEIIIKSESAEDYLKKFFIDKIKLPSVDYIEIINKLEIFDLFLRNTDIQENIIDEYKKNEKQLLSSINRNKGNTIFEVTKPELIEKKKKDIMELGNNRNKLGMYNFDYFKILRVFENPRSYQSILNLYEDCKERIVEIYHFDRLEIYENLLLRVAFYKEIYGNEKFNKDTLEDEKPLTYKLLFDNVKSDLDKSIITTLINFSNDEIVEAKKMVESKRECTLNIETIINNLNKYYEVFNKTNGFENLLNFFKKNRKHIEEKLIKKGLNEELYFGFFSRESPNSFIGLVYVDRINYSLENDSLICNLYKEIYKLRIEVHSVHIPGLERDIRILSNEVLKKISKNYEERDGYNSFAEIKEYFIKSNTQNIVEILQELKAKNTEINQIEKKYIEYLIEILKIYCFESKETPIEKLKNEIFTIAEQIKENEKNRKVLTLTLENIKKFEELDNKYLELSKDLEIKLYYILSPFNFPLEKNEDLEWRIELWKAFDKKGIEYYEYNNYYREDKRTLSQHYKEFVDKGFEPDEDFEKILKKANKDIFQK